MCQTQPVDLLIFGAGGHAKVACDCAREAYPHLLMVTGGDVPGEWQGIAIVPQATRTLDAWRTLCPRAFVAIGDGHARQRVTRALAEVGFTLVPLVHPRAVVSPSARLAAGVMVAAGAVVNADAQLDEGCIVNTGAIVEHECVVGAFAHLSPRAVLGGGTVVGAHGWVCLGAAVTDHVRIGDHTTVGAGAAVLADLPGRVLAVGVPARIRKQYDRAEGIDE